MARGCFGALRNWRGAADVKRRLDPAPEASVGSNFSIRQLRVLLEMGNNHLPMFDFGTASFSISRCGGCSAGDVGLERFDAPARAEPCVEEGTALIGWTGAGDANVLADGPVTARACPGGAGVGRAGIEAGAATVRGRTFIA
jgi:hypothetical protein